MQSNRVGGITQKAQQAHTSSINGSPETDYSLSYTYSTAQPHALDEVTDGTYTYVYSYDANGNMTQKTQDTDPIMAALWDEADRMRAVRNLNGISHYIYDANGQRLMKGGIDMDFASFDSQEMPGGGWVVKPYTIYVNPYLVFNGDGYVFDTSPDRFTKHYYAGSERVASRLNREGQSATEHTTNNIYSPTAAYAPVLVNLQAALTDFGLSPDLNADPAGYPPNPIEYEEDCQEQFSNDPIEIERCLCLHFPAAAAEQSIPCPSYEPIYWYHPDYLGHTDFVTDRTGQPYQHFFYAPFGEALLSQHTGTGYYNTPYRFNAKELDSETGLIYYGARYYEPKESVWLSVDAKHSSFPGMNPYNFSLNNPVLLVDPDGNAPDHYFSRQGRYLGSDGFGDNVRIHHFAQSPTEFRSWLRENSLFDRSNSSDLIRFIEMSPSELLSLDDSKGEATKLMILDLQYAFACYKEPSQKSMNSTLGDDIATQRIQYEDFSVRKDLGGNENQIIFGTLHRHQSGEEVTLIGQVTIDGHSDEESARNFNLPIFAVSKNSVSGVLSNGTVIRSLPLNSRLLKNTLINYGLLQE